MRHSILFVLASLASVGCHPAIDQNLECTIEYLDGNVVEDAEAHLGEPMAFVDFVYDPHDAATFNVPGKTYAATLRVTTNRSSVFEWVMRFHYVNFAVDANADGAYDAPSEVRSAVTYFASDFVSGCDYYERVNEAWVLRTLESFAPSPTYGEGLAQFAHDPEADFPVPEGEEAIEGAPIPHVFNQVLACSVSHTDAKIAAWLPKPSSATWGLVEYHNRRITPVLMVNNGTVLNDTPPVLDPEPMN